MSRRGGLRERRRDLLTASGGPFWKTSREAMERADLSSALAHPTWRMGTKNTIDSATMMNKGLEVIEASRLFGFEGDRIGIVVHPQSVAHGFVVFRDGSIKSQLAAPDMRVPIGYALAYPNRLRSRPAAAGDSAGVLRTLGAKDGDAVLRYEFEPPDPARFPCVRLAYDALAAGGTQPAVLSPPTKLRLPHLLTGRSRSAGFPRSSRRDAGRRAVRAYLGGRTERRSASAGSRRRDRRHHRKTT